MRQTLGNERAEGARPNVSSFPSRFRSGMRHNSIDEGSKMQPIQSRYDRWQANGEKASVAAILNPKYSFGNQFRTFYEVRDGEQRDLQTLNANQRRDRSGVGSRALKAAQSFETLKLCHLIWSNFTKIIKNQC